MCRDQRARTGAHDLGHRPDVVGQQLDESSLPALATRSGLAPASVTGLLDRLEQRGMIRRARDPADGRRVLIELDRERMAALQPMFAEFVVDLQRLAAAFTTDELEVVLRFLRQATAVQEAATTRLAERAEPESDQPRRARRR